MRKFCTAFPIWNAVPSELQRLPIGDERIADSHSKLPIGEVRPTSLNVEPTVACDGFTSHTIKVINRDVI